MGIKIGVNCMVCGSTFESEEPTFCCSGRDCGCLGMPIEPEICSDKCYEEFLKKGIPNPEIKEFVPLQIKD